MIQARFKLSSKRCPTSYVHLENTKSLAVSETAHADSLITQVVARDTDTGENSRVSFLRAKFGVRDLFNIKEERGVITGVNTNIYYSILQGKIIENH